jgi:hypothetical protein
MGLIKRYSKCESRVTPAGPRYRIWLEVFLEASNLSKAWA